MQRPNPEVTTLADILITEELSRRVSRTPDLHAENQAMRMLIRQMAQNAASLIQTLVDTAMELCAAGTTGVSLLETTADGEEIFRWYTLAGTLAHQVGGSTARNFSPCGVCLEQGSPVLFSHPERYFTYLQEANITIVEGLVLPLIADNHVLGTIWIVSHDEQRQFDSEDVRVMTSLADFTATALLLQQHQTGGLLAANAVLETELIERKQVEAQTQALIANLPGGAVFVVDRDLRYLLAEGEALSAAGFKPEDFMGRTIFEVLPPELAASYEPMYRQALAGEPFEHEHQAHHYTYLSRGTPLRSEDGEIYAVLVVSYNISDRKRIEDERKRAEQTLRESEARQAFLLQMSDALRAEPDADAVANCALQMLFEQMQLDRCYIGVYRLADDRGDFTHQVGNDRVPPLPDEVRLSDFPDALRVAFDRTLVIDNIMETEGLTDTDRQNLSALGLCALVAVTLRKGDNPLWSIVAVSASPRHWTWGEVALLEEVTERTWLAIERTRAEESLTQSEAKYRSLFNSIDNGFCIIERVPGEQIDFRYLEANPAFVMQTGINHVVGKTIREVVPGLSETIYEIYENVWQTGEPIRAEIDLPSLDRILEIYAFQIKDEPRLAVIFKDISDRKRREMILRENEVRQAFLLKLSDILQQFVQPNDIKAAAMRLLGEHLGVSRAQYHECDSSGEYYSADGVGYANGLPLLDLKYRIDAFGTFVNEDFAAGRPYRIDDLEVDPRVSAEEREAYRSYQIRAGAGVPLIRGGKLVAILAIHDVRPHHWTDLEMDLIRETAERIWTPLERARAEAALEEDLRNTQMLHNLATRLISEEDRQALYQQIVKTAIALTQADAGSFQILDHTTQELVLIATQGVDRTMAEHFHRLDASSNTSCGIALTTGERTFLNFDVPESEDPDGSLRMHRDAGLRCVQSTPLRSRSGEPIGMISTHWREDHQLSDRESRFLDLLARQAADIIEQRQAEESRIQLIHEQTAREQERQRAESLAELDRAKTLFFSNISHEFRTPLTLSLAPLQDALKSVDEWMSAESYEFSVVSSQLEDNTKTQNSKLKTQNSIPTLKHNLELAHRNSLRLLKLVNTLLDFSRIEAGRIQALYEPTDLATFTAELSSAFRSAIEQAGLQLIVDCPPLPEPVFVDREMWEKIVLNLLSNAFKFTFEGEICVSLRVKDWRSGGVAEWESNDPQPPTPSDPHTPYAILQIRDTGAGIATEHLPHLFERFYQVRGSQARTHEGSGIGLALVYELVRLQGGTIEVNSTVGEGTCFTIAIPFGTAHLPQDRLCTTRTLASTAMNAITYVEEAKRWLATDSKADETDHSSAENERFLESADLPSASSVTKSAAHVLLVDDNADMREYLTRILSDHVQIEAVADGATALAVAQARVPDLILSDVMMPGLNGFELLGALRADPRTREIPIILISARAGEEAIVEGLKAGADDYLIKPFSAQELTSRVMAHLQMAQLRGEALQEARSTIRSRDEFISVISHELNTPLVSILGWTRMLRSSPPNPVMLSKALDTIERNAVLQGKLVQDLLDISRITAGKLRLHPQPIELKPVIETAIATVTQPAADKSIHLIWQENVTEPVVVMGDSDRFQQVICNLLTNAIKFTPEGGRVEISLSVVISQWSLVKNNRPMTTDKGLMTKDDYAEIRITDTGIGIATDFLPHVFDRFRQAEGAHSVKGLGLGLAIARHIVELHSGTIHAESAGEGQGAIFSVKLPLFKSVAHP